MSAFGEIRYEVDEHITTITFNRPEQRDPISVAMLDFIRRASRAPGATPASLRGR